MEPKWGYSRPRPAYWPVQWASSVSYDAQKCHAVLKHLLQSHQTVHGRPQKMECTTTTS